MCICNQTWHDQTTIVSFGIDTAPSFLSKGHSFLSWGKTARALSSPLTHIYAEVKKKWSCTSAPPICLHDVDKDNFTFALLHFTVKFSLSQTQGEGKQENLLLSSLPSPTIQPPLEYWCTWNQSPI